MRLGHGGHGCGDIGEFQSQTRSRSTCDLSLVLLPGLWTDGFQSQTRSRSTCDKVFRVHIRLQHLVSISDEKPLHMRPSKSQHGIRWTSGFNLRREAAPHATHLPALSRLATAGFNLRREAAPHATRLLLMSVKEVLFVSISDEKPLHMRLANLSVRTDGIDVSISDEKPLHMRPTKSSGRSCYSNRFNLRREAAPHATPSPSTPSMPI